MYWTCTRKKTLEWWIVAFTEIKELHRNTRYIKVIFKSIQILSITILTSSLDSHTHTHTHTYTHFTWKYEQNQSYPEILTCKTTQTRKQELNLITATHPLTQDHNQVSGPAPCFPPRLVTSITAASLSNSVMKKHKSDSAHWFMPLWDYWQASIQ